MRHQNRKTKCMNVFWDRLGGVYSVFPHKELDVGEMVVEFTHVVVVVVLPVVHGWEDTAASQLG